MIKIPFFQSQKEKSEKDKFTEKLRAYGISQEEYNALLAAKGIAAADYVNFQSVTALLKTIEEQVSQMEIEGRNLSTYQDAPLTPDTALSPQERSLHKNITNVRKEGLSAFDSGLTKLNKQIERFSEKIQPDNAVESVKRQLLLFTASFRKDLTEQIDSVQKEMTPIGIKLDALIETPYSKNPPVSRGFWEKLPTLITVLVLLFVSESYINFYAFQGVINGGGAFIFFLTFLTGLLMAVSAHFTGSGFGSNKKADKYLGVVSGIVGFGIIVYFRFFAQTDDFASHFMQLALSFVIYVLSMYVSYYRQPDLEYWMLKDKYGKLEKHYNKLRQQKELYEEHLSAWLEIILERRAENKQDFLSRKEDIAADIETCRRDFTDKLDALWQDGTDAFRAGVRKQESFFNRTPDKYWFALPPSLKKFGFSENKINLNNHRRGSRRSNFKGRNPIGFRRY